MSDEPTIPATVSNDWTLSGVVAKEVTLTPEAATALSQADSALQSAQSLRDAVLRGILAQAGVGTGKVVDVKQGPPMVLVLQVPT